MPGRSTFRTLLTTSLLGLSVIGCGSRSGRSDFAQVSSRGESRTESIEPAATAVSSTSSEEPSQTRSDPQPDLIRVEQLFGRLVSPVPSTESWDEILDQLLKEERAAKVLGKKLAAGTAPERELAASTLALMGPDALSAEKELTAALQDELPFVRANAAATLVQLPDHAEQAIPTLMQLLFSNDPQLRQLAAVNLNAAGVAMNDHVEQFRQTLQQENSEDVLTPVVELLGRIGRPAESALPELRKIARQQPGELGAKANSAIQLISGEMELAAP